MANTHGFEVIAEVTENTLNNLLKAAWKSGGDSSDEGVIPEYIKIPGPSVPAPVVFGPYEVKEGFVQIPQEQLHLSMNTGINGVDVKLGTIIHIEIANPPVDSAKFFDLTADVTIQTPVREVGPDHEVGADLLAIPPNGINVNITSGNPITAIVNNSTEEFVHKKYQEKAIPNTIDPIPLSFFVFNMKLRIDFYDDLSNPAKKITVSKPDATHIKVSIPCHLRFYEITGSFSGFSLKTPMGVDGIAEMLADYVETADHILVKTSTATVTLTNLTPTPGEEGSNYTQNKTMASLAGQDLDNVITTGFATGAASQLKAFGDISVFVPTLQQIQDFAAQKIRAELERRKKIQVWKIEDPTGTTTINNLQIKALSDSLALCINGSGGADANAVTNFIPGGRDFAIATSAQKVSEEFEKKEKEQYGHNIPPSKRLDQPVEGKKVDLNELGIELHNGHLSVVGDVTVIDAIADSIDVDAGFEQKVTLHWEDVPAGGQTLKHELDGEPDVSLSAAAWLLSALIGFITFGIIGLIIGLVVIAVVEGVASSIGGNIARDESGKVESIGAWPGSLDDIGSIKARFENPVIIEDSGLVFTGNMIITSQFALTSVDMARSNGPYTTSGNIPVQFNGGVDKPSSAARWVTGDGQLINVRNSSHRYGRSGLYIANVQVKVNEEGGATTLHYAKVQVENVIPKVNFSQNEIFTQEGTEIELQITFTDDNWLDTHIAWIDYGDNSAPENLTLTESNKEPQCSGSISAKHAWCDNGTFKVTVYVKDSAGGIGEATCVAVVENVVPKILVPKRLCVLKDQAVRLEAIFTDPGWCDTHVATWDCGDSTLKMATIRERHKSPQGVGIASVVHIYCCPGNYLARITVTDDDGGETSACTIVSVVSLGNANFENGFRKKPADNQRELTLATVANEWLPFAQPILNLDVSNKDPESFKTAHFIPDEFICRNGQRAQGIELQGSGIAGIRQKICVNKGWDYEFTAYFHLPTASTGKFCIGIDAAGGIDATSNDISWVQVLPVDEWVHASVRVTAKANRITCFTGVQEPGGASILYLDKCALYMIQPLNPIPLITDRGDEEKDEDCEPRQIDKHDFTHLDNYIAGDNLILSYPANRKYESTLQGVRFSDEENIQPYFSLNKETGTKLMSTVAKGILQTSVGVAKTMVKSILGMKRGN